MFPSMAMDFGCAGQSYLIQYISHILLAIMHGLVVDFDLCMQLMQFERKTRIRKAYQLIPCRKYTSSSSPQEKLYYYQIINVQR